MKIEVRILTSNNDATLSGVFIDGGFQCFGLEDEKRDVKIVGETRIPRGKYKIGLRKVGGFHGRYSKKFPAFHRGMLQVLDVPGFKYVLIHIGNTDDDTAGCLIVGRGANTGAQLTITNSTYAYADLYRKVIDAAERGELTIEYINHV